MGRERGVSPVVGIVLMTAIVVVLAAVVGGLALGFSDKLDQPPPAGGFAREYVSTGAGNTDNRPYVTITHQLGETVDGANVIISDDAGNEVRWVDVWTAGPRVRAGEYVHIDGFGSDSALDPICEEGDSYVVTVETDEGETLLVNRWTAPIDPTPPAGSPADSDGDGVVDWC